MTDAEIEAAVASDPDAPPLADHSWFERARLVDPANMEWVDLHIDRDVLAWFRAQDAECHWLMGQALWEYARANGAHFNGPRAAERSDAKTRDAA